MEIASLKNILKDKIKMAYLISFLTLGIVAYFLLMRHDLGTFYKSQKTIYNSNKNLKALKKIEKYTKYSNKFNSEFAVEKNAYKLIEIITKSAKNRSVVLDEVKPIESGAVEGHLKISIAIEGMASYNNVAHFISDLEASDKLLITEELSMRADDISMYSDMEGFMPGHEGLSTIPEGPGFGEPAFPEDPGFSPDGMPRGAMPQDMPPEGMMPGEELPGGITEEMIGEGVGMPGKETRPVPAIKGEPLIAFRLVITGFSPKK
ncbi:MAG: hypothetical protein HQ549_02685 [Candidatus Omnitrophica bacterium]|nr:hypothetical protein [Candidatus Omnitrophota bacterium]